MAEQHTETAGTMAEHQIDQAEQIEALEARVRHLETTLHVIFTAAGASFSQLTELSQRGTPPALSTVPR